MCDERLESVRCCGPVRSWRADSARDGHPAPVLWAVVFRGHWPESQRCCSMSPSAGWRSHASLDGFARPCSCCGLVQARGRDHGINQQVRDRAVSVVQSEDHRSMRRCLQNLRPRDHDHLYDIVHVEGGALSVPAQLPSGPCSPSMRSEKSSASLPPGNRETVQAAPPAATAGCRSRCVDIRSGRASLVRSASSINRRARANRTAR